MKLIKILVFKYSTMFNIDPHLALSVIQVESNFDPYTIGTLGEIGLFQIRPEFVTIASKDLFDVETNIRTGISLLAKKKKHCSHKEFIVCYNAGIEGAKKIKNPKEFPYYKKVMKVYATYK
jgi:soluble lytic murein transglycosylase-like protein